ncbi:MAG: redoxin domain-containing protein [Proteobacteria bacterium]|nr:redoxin domain-containing protein [Pseudomonadota bacterium]
MKYIILLMLFAAAQATGCCGKEAPVRENEKKIETPATPKVEAQVETAPKERPKLADPTAYAMTDETSLGTLPPGIGIPVGKKVEDFTVLDAEGQPTRLSELVSKGKIMLFFYRGGW